MKLQTFRKFLITLSMLLFPITIYYFSPYLIIMAALQHIINGSFIGFTLMFILGIFFGRLWCGFLCPTGGLSECFERFSPKNPKQGWRNYLKYGIWVLWLSGVIICHVLGKGDELHTAECILCGECISTCPKKVLNYKITNK